MKKTLPFIIVVLAIFMTIAGCSNPFSDKEPATTVANTTTEEQTTVQGNSDVITLQQETVASTASKKYTYYSDNLECTFTIPEQWLNKYVIEDSIDSKGVRYVKFFEVNNHNNSGKGLLMKFCLYPDESYKKCKSYTLYGTATDVDGKAYYIVCVLPSGTQYDKKSSGFTKAYAELNKEKYITSICNKVKFDNNYTVDKDENATIPYISEPTMVEESTSSTAKPKTTNSNSANNSGQSGLVFSDISQRKLSEDEVRAHSQDEIQQAINDICALHGYNFTTPSIKEHYSQFSWYKPLSSFSEASFNDIEKYNYELLQKCRG